MNMQNQLHTMQFFSVPDNQFTAETMFKLPAKSRFEKCHGNQKKLKNLLPPANPIHKLFVTFMLRNISTGQLGYLSVCALSQLLHTCSLAE